MKARRVLSFAVVAICQALAAHAQTAPPPELRAGTLDAAHSIDGRLDEVAWASAGVIDAFTQADPREGAPASARTTVRVLAGPKALVIGIDCEQPAGVGVVSFNVRRDAALTQEDHVRIVLGPFMDGRSGYVFALNPSGARYDGIVNPGGENDNAEWDGIWDAVAIRRDGGWSAEVWIPFLTLSFKPGLDTWHFNVQRRIQGLLETDRWASAGRQYQVTQTSRAGLLTNLPAIDLGQGLSVRPAVRAGAGVPSPSADVDAEFRGSLDVTKRLGANLLASATVNTDFAETEVDTRRTNLTRFPVFFPEKRTFFLEGDDIFAFGLGLDQDVLPYFSRRIGLVAGTEVPIVAGGKLNGRVGNTNLGGLVVGTNDRAGVVDDESMMAVARVKQNLWRESWLGAMATVGDPLGGSGRWLVGGDFTYATSRLRGDKNFLVGVWGLATDRHAGADASRLRREGGLPQRQVGHRLQLQAHRARLRAGAGVRAAPRRAVVQSRHRQPDPHRPRALPAAGARVPPVRGHRPCRPVGELPRVLRAHQLAVPQRRPLRGQREPGGGAPGRAVRGVERRGDRARELPLDDSIAWRSAPPRNAASTRRSRGGSAASTTARSIRSSGRAPGTPPRFSPSSSPVSETWGACRRVASIRHSSATASG